MSPASSGRYQSRLFNFVHQHSRRLSERLASAFRHVQVATTWGAQVLLYPLYLLFQSTESVRKLHIQNRTPLQPADDINAQPQIPSLNTDTPIQRVLLLVDTIPFEETTAIPSADKTEPLNFLGFDAQAGLAALLRFKFFSNSLTHPSSTRNCPIVQGIATQLSTRTLVLITAQNQILDILTLQQQQKLQERITGEVAEYWRCLQIQSGGSRGEVVGSKKRTFSLPALRRTLALLKSIRLTPISAVTKVNETHTFRIQALIWAAIDYFFGYRSGNLGQTKLTNESSKIIGSAPKKPLPSRQLTTQLLSSDVNPWLTLSDLFGSESEPSSQHISATVSAKNLVLPSSKSGWDLLRNRFNLQISPQPRQLSRRKAISNQPLSQAHQLNSGSEWIETHATTIGYVKHPLEQFLEWLDYAMLWLEEILVSILQLMQQLWRGK